MSCRFSSYRRNDSAVAAQFIYDRLDARLPRIPVFIDVDEILPGSDFRTVIRDTLCRCTLLLAVIGPEWAESHDQASSRRLDNPADFVRLELEGALSRGVPIILVLVRGAMPLDMRQLPPSLAGLGRCPMVEVRPYPYAEGDLERLLHAMVTLVPALRRWGPSYPRLTVLVVLVLACQIAVSFMLVPFVLGGSPPPFPFAVLLPADVLLEAAELGCLVTAAFIAGRLQSSMWVAALVVSLGLATPIFGLIGPIKRMRRGGRPSTPHVWDPVGVQR